MHIKTHTKHVTKQSGFTVVELLIIIVIIGVLAGITMIAYTGVQDRARFATEQTDLAEANKLVHMFYVGHGEYPSTAGLWTGLSQASDYIPGIVPEYAAKIPQMPSSLITENSFMYKSNGTDYKLIRYSSTAGLPSAQRTSNSLADPQRDVNEPGGAWGYWTSGAIGW